mgnify:CR=1 FL=1
MRNLSVSAVVLALAASGAAYAVESGQPAPQCVAKSFNATQPALDISQLRGKVVYVDFWASWCGPCAQSFPFMNELDRDMRDRGVQVVGISVDDKASDAETFLTKRPANFAVAIDSSGACPSSFQVKGMPTSYLIDRNGVVRHVHVGFKAGDAAKLRAVAEQLLAEEQLSAN